MEKGIIFDMDGTLWDSSENVARSWDKVIQKEAGGLRRITREDIKRVMGHTMTEIAQMLFPMLDLKEAVELTVTVKRKHQPNPEVKEIYDRNYEIYLELYKNLKETMKKQENRR